MKSDLAVVILAAGHGTRMKSVRPKVLHEIAGLPMLVHVLNTAKALQPSRLIVVVGPAHADVARVAAEHGAATAVQHHQRGTGDAARAALPALEGFDGNVLILNGDGPLLRAETLAALIAPLQSGMAITVLGFRPKAPAHYGRLIETGNGRLAAIVEARDASDAQKQTIFCNGGAYAANAAVLRRQLAKLSDANAQNEFYLTDIVAHATDEGLICRALEADESEVAAVNSRAELAAAEALWQQRARDRFMAAGVTLISPETIFFSADTQIEADVTIGPHAVFGPGVRIAAHAVIRPYCHIEGAVIGPGALIGPFARLRPGTVLGAGVHIGNFVETKQATLGDGAKANHLTYLGDAEIGARANIGAGTITCNYDGFFKYKTVIGENAFIGSNTALVAPVVVGAGAYVGAASAITKDVPADALAVERATQKISEGWAAAFRAKMQAKKNSKKDQ